jgi:signal transduction histidine kinase/DNA-binding response OmpR family regulator
MNEAVKLLVIDDDEVDRLHLKRALKTCGFEYKLTERDDATLIDDFIHEHLFDCIFLDYFMPGDNGLSLLKKIREKGVKTPIVIITSQGNESIAVELMKAGASDYIIKNQINGPALGQVLRNMFRMSKVEQEREETERALKISESRLAEAQRIAKIGSWDFETSTKTIHWSSEFYNIFGLNQNKFAPTVENFFNYIHPEDRDLILSTSENALKGLSFNIDFRIIKSEEIKHLNAQGYASLDATHLPSKIVGTLQDITERKLAEKEILKARELAEHSTKAKEVFLANMSHEIRTPMNAILGFTRLLYETGLSNEQKSCVDAIHFSGENLLVIINDILDLSKIGSGKMTLEKCEFRLDELVKGVISTLTPKGQEKGLEVTANISPDVPLSIIGDPVRLNQVLTNLINNAIKFTDTGGVYLEVKSNGKDGNTFLLDFMVRDTGIGIPEEMQSMIFEDFVQASGDTTRKYGGTGLGLSIVKKIVELHQGKISVVSTPGVGSIFITQLPFEKGSDTASAQSTTKNVPSTSESLEPLQGARILIAEDNSVNQLLIKKVLTKTGCLIDIASNGLEAIKRLTDGNYDVILMDVQMPEMDGHEATLHIRNKLSPPFSEIPIIAMTAHAFGSDVNKCFDVGMNDYVSKPFKPEDLYAKLIKCIAKRSNVSNQQKEQEKTYNGQQ